MLFIYIYFFIFYFAYGCLLAFYFKCLLIVTFSRRLIFIKSAYTFCLSIFFAAVIGTKEAYEYSIISFLKVLLRRSTITSDLMPYKIHPQLAVTVKCGTCTKTVYAFIDTGALNSYICNKLANELNAESSETIVYANSEKEKFMNIEFGKQNDDQFTKIKLKLTSVLFGSSLCKNKKAHLFAKIARIASFLNISMFDVPEETDEKLLIGADLIPFLLFKSPLLPNRIISLATNLNLIETRLGFYIQGTQFNSEIDFCHNWLHNSLQIHPLNSFLSYVLITFFFVLLFDKNYTNFFI